MKQDMQIEVETRQPGFLQNSLSAYAGVAVFGIVTVIGFLVLFWGEERLVPANIGLFLVFMTASIAGLAAGAAQKANLRQRAERRAEAMRNQIQAERRSQLDAFRRSKRARSSDE